MSQVDVSGGVCFLCCTPNSLVVESAKPFINCWAEFLSSDPNSEDCGQLGICENCFESCAPFCELYKEWKELERQLMWRLSQILQNVNPIEETSAPDYGTVAKLKNGLLQKSREKLGNRKQEISQPEIKTEGNSSDAEERLSEMQVEEEPQQQDDLDNVSVTEVIFPNLGIKMEDASPENGSDSDSDPLLESDNDDPVRKTKRQPKRKKYKPNSGTYPCTAFNCQMTFENASQLETHLTHHGEFPCNFCPSTFTYAPELSLHETETHSVISKTTTTYRTKVHFQCARCPVGVTRKGIYLRHHLQKHLGLKIITAQCPECKVELWDKWALKKHQRFHQIEGLPPSQIFTCSQCSVQFNSTAVLAVHQKQVHLKSQNVCPTCGKAFTVSKNLKNHMRAAHPETPAPDQDYPFPCPTPSCGKRFHQEVFLQRHLKTCGKELVCSKCGKVFQSKRSLESHVTTQHRERTCVCDECGKAFVYPSLLQDHKISKHKNGEEANIECSECGKRFFTVRRLNMHMKDVHSGSRHLCSDCGMSFTTPKNLRRHARSKHGQKGDALQG